MDITAHAPDTDHVEGVLIGLIIAARFPIVVGLFALVRGMPVPLLVLIVVGTAGIAAVVHPLVVTAIEDQARSRSPRGS